MTDVPSVSAAAPPHETFPKFYISSEGVLEVIQLNATDFYMQSSAITNLDVIFDHNLFYYDSYVKVTVTTEEGEESKKSTIYMVKSSRNVDDSDTYEIFEPKGDDWTKQTVNLSYILENNVAVQSLPYTAKTSLGLATITSFGGQAKEPTSRPKPKTKKAKSKTNKSAKVNLKMV
jgi:hypothetical protein